MFDPKVANNNLKKKSEKELNFHDIDLLKQLNKTNITISNLNGVSNKIPNPAILLQFI